KVRIGTTRFRHGDAVTAIAFAPDGRGIATASRDGTLSLWAADSGKEVIRFQGHAGAVLDVGFSSGGKRLIFGGSDGTVRLWRVPGLTQTDGPMVGEEERCFRVSKELVQAVAIAANGSIVAAGTSDGVVVLWDMERGGELRRLRQE